MKLAGTKRKAAEGVCKELFPQMANPFGGNPGAAHHLGWRRSQRICSDDMFDRYFILGVPVGDITRSELDAIARLAETPADLMAELVRFVDDGRFLTLTDRLPDVIPLLNVSAIRGYCLTLLEVVDRFTDERSIADLLGTTSQLTQIISRALGRLSNDERCSWVLERINSGHNLGALIRLVAREEKSQGRRPSDAIFEDSCIRRLFSPLVLSRCGGKRRAAS